MTITAHALVGGAIAATVPSPVFGFILALISHPLLDLVPHWDEGWGWRTKGKVRLFAECFLDLSIGLLLTFYFFSSVPTWYLLLAIFASLLPDILEAPYLLLGWKFKPFCWFYQMQHHLQGKVVLPWGILTQVLTVAMVMFMLHGFTL